jgi:uncharacterized membrane protein
MQTVEQSIEINCPVTTVYNQWTQFEEFPRFMAGVREVEQLDDTHLRWSAEIGGKEETWEAEITEQKPDQRIAWHSVSGAKNAGVVTFHRLSDDKTKVMLQLEYEPEGVVEKAGSAVGAVTQRVQGDLERFKEFIEQRGSETGAWRGEVT